MLSNALLLTLIELLETLNLGLQFRRFLADTSSHQPDNFSAIGVFVILGDTDFLLLLLCRVLVKLFILVKHLLESRFKLLITLHESRHLHVVLPSQRAVAALQFLNFIFSRLFLHCLCVASLFGHSLGIRPIGLSSFRSGIRLTGQLLFNAVC